MSSRAVPNDVESFCCSNRSRTDHSKTAREVTLSESLATWLSWSADPSRTLKPQRRLAVGQFERSTEVAMTRKPQVEGQRSQVVILTEQIERTCQSQLQLIAIKRYTFDALEYLCQVHRRDPNLGGDIGQS